jgi:hypothetical protein
MGLHSKNKIMLCMFEIHRVPSVSWQDTTLFGWDSNRREMEHGGRIVFFKLFLYYKF